MTISAAEALHMASWFLSAVRDVRLPLSDDQRPHESLFPGAVMVADTIPLTV